MADVSDQQGQQLLASVGNENWQSAFELSGTYLKDMKDDDERLPRLRYIYLFTAAGKVCEHQMSFEDLEKITTGFAGKQIIFPWRPIATDDNSPKLNAIKRQKESENLFVAATNKEGTTVHDFEYIKLAEPFDLKSHNGELASVSGLIDSVEPQPKENRTAALLVVMRIHISKAQVKLKPPEAG